MEHSRPAEQVLLRAGDLDSTFFYVKSDAANDLRARERLKGQHKNEKLPLVMNSSPF
jgi:hypothetical protein